MRNFFKLFGIGGTDAAVLRQTLQGFGGVLLQAKRLAKKSAWTLIFLAVIGFSFVACGDGSGGESVPAAPSGLTATAYSSSAITINWNAVPGATGYNVYNGATSAVTYVGVVYSNFALNYDLPANTTVYYRVTAINSQGESGMSNLAYATTLGTGNYSLNGTWEISGGGLQITVSGSSAVIKSMTSANPLWTSALNKGYVKVGDQYWRNISSTGNLTWSAQVLHVNYNSSSPNVATGTVWSNCTITMSANGQTLETNGSDTSGPVTSNWTRR